MRIIPQILISLIQFIRNPLFGPAVCFFKPSCTVFACEQLQKESLAKALLAIGKRLIACNPFTK